MLYAINNKINIEPSTCRICICGVYVYSFPTSRTGPEYIQRPLAVVLKVDNGDLPEISKLQTSKYDYSCSSQSKKPNYTSRSVLQIAIESN